MRRTYGQEQEIFIDYYDDVRDVLDDRQKGVLLDLLVNNAKGEEQESDDAMVMMAYRFMRNGIKRVEERYQQKCEANRENVNKRWNKKGEKL